MKQLAISILLLATTQWLLASPLEEPETFPAVPDEVYAPQGFDTNDNVEIFFEGLFHNACYKVGLTFHTVDEESKSIYITDTAHYFGNAFCASVMVPYQKGIKAGYLTSGEYRVLFRQSRGNFVESGYFYVSEAAVDRPDDHLYAPVKATRFFYSDGSKPPHLKLYGEFHNTCMSLDYVRVITRPFSNVVDILPIAKMDRGGCEPVISGIPFQHEVDLSDLPDGRFLLHTRALNGQSVNEIVTITR